MITRRLFLKRSALAAPAVILTQHLLMPVRQILKPPLIYDTATRDNILEVIARVYQIPIRYLSGSEKLEVFDIPALYDHALDMVGEKLQVAGDNSVFTGVEPVRELDLLSL